MTHPLAPPPLFPVHFSFKEAIQSKVEGNTYHLHWWAISQRSTDINVLLTICHILSLVDVIFYDNPFLNFSGFLLRRSQIEHIWPCLFFFKTLYLLLMILIIMLLNLIKTFSSILLDLYCILGFFQCCNLNSANFFISVCFLYLSFSPVRSSIFHANKISNFFLTWDFPIFQKIDPLSSAQHFPLSIIWLEYLGKPRSLAALIHCEIPKKDLCKT